MFYAFEGFIPVVDPSAYVHPQAVITGNVIIGKDVYIGPGAMLRGDWGGIHVGDGCNVQENCVIHMFPGVIVRLEEGAHIGHGACIHGARIGKNCLIGIHSVVLDRVDLGDESIVGAMTLLTEGMQIPPRSLVVGTPGKIIRQVSEEMLRWKTEGTELYQRLPQAMKETASPCEPLRELPPERPIQSEGYLTWKKTQG
jgi:phenylacetic acid degradation protein